MCSVIKVLSTVKRPDLRLLQLAPLRDSTHFDIAEQLEAYFEHKYTRIGVFKLYLTDNTSVRDKKFSCFSYAIQQKNMYSVHLES